MQVDARMRFACDLLLQRLNDARFPDTGFADHGHDLAFTMPRQMPAFAHQSHFMRPADQRQATGADRGKATFDGGFTQTRQAGTGRVKPFKSCSPTWVSSKWPPDNF